MNRTLPIVLLLAACVVGRAAPPTCAEVEVRNQNFADVHVYVDGRFRLGDVGGFSDRTFTVCQPTPPVFRVRAIGGAFEFVAAGHDRVLSTERTTVLVITSPPNRSHVR